MHFIDPEDTGSTRRHGSTGHAPDRPQPLSLSQWLAARVDWPESRPAGVRLENTDDVTQIAPDLPRLALVVLHFPRWTDGRAYSQARLLRGRHRFVGELRAEGDVVADMAQQLARTGFDSARLRAGEDPGVARRSLRAFEAYYQADALQPRPLFSRLLEA